MPTSTRRGSPIRAPPCRCSVTRGWTAALTGIAIDRRNARDMVKRHVAADGLLTSICNHSFRGTSIAIFLERSGMLETAQDIAGPADIRSTPLYHGLSRTTQRTEVERVQL